MRAYAQLATKMQADFLFDHRATEDTEEYPKWQLSLPSVCLARKAASRVLAQWDCAATVPSNN